jgi:hypothetical protein
MCTRKGCIYKHPKKASPVVDKAKSKKAKEKRKKLAHHKGMIAKLEAESGDDDQPEGEDEIDQESQEEEQADESSAEDSADSDQEDE